MNVNSLWPPKEFEKHVLLLDFNLLLFKKFHLRLFTFLLKNFMLN